MTYVGQRMKRFEDPRLLRGDGSYLDDMTFPGMVHALILRSPHAHARIVSIDSTAARNLPGVLAVHTWEDLEGVVGTLLKNASQTISTAESCTGGYIAHLLTSIPGSSAYFIGSVVAYSNRIKEEVLGVNPDIIDNNGAVSEEVVQSMAEGIRSRFNTDYGISCSGIAGPDGGTEEKPVGTVWICIASEKTTVSRMFSFGPNRKRTIRITALTALNMLRKLIAEEHQIDIESGE